MERKVSGNALLRIRASRGRERVAKLVSGAVGLHAQRNESRDGPM
jgi:hypothetical protein